METSVLVILFIILYLVSSYRIIQYKICLDRSRDVILPLRHL